MSTTNTKSFEERVLQDITHGKTNQVFQPISVNQNEYELVFPDAFTLHSSELTEEEWNTLVGGQRQ